MREQDHVVTLTGLGASPPVEHPQDGAWTEPDFTSTYSAGVAPSQRAEPPILGDEAGRWEDALRRDRGRVSWLVPAAVALAGVGLVTLIIAAFTPSERALGATRAGHAATTVAAPAPRVGVEGAGVQAPRVRPVAPATAPKAAAAARPKASASAKATPTPTQKSSAPTKSSRNKSGSASQSLYGRR